MTRSEAIVQEVYLKHSELWENAWKKKIINGLALSAKGHLVVYPVAIDPQIANLANPAQRFSLVGDASEQIIDEFVAPKGPFRALLVDVFQSSALGLPSISQLRKLLMPLIMQSIETHKSSEILASVSEYEVYTELANILDQELYRVAVSNSQLDERLVLNYSLLAYYFRRWRIPFAQLNNALSSLCEGRLEIRGHLISIQNLHRPMDNIGEFILPIVPFVSVTFEPTIKACSNVLEVVESEAEAIIRHTGFFHRAMPISNPVNPALLSISPNINQTMAEQGRLLYYPQYEHTALLFMSLTGIEFLLRSFCPVARPPDESPVKLIELHATLPGALRDRLVNIFSSEQWNIRNRSMHGSFLELEGRRDDLIRSSGILDNFGVPRVDLSKDGSLPLNVSALVLQALGELVQHLNTVATPCATSWTQHFLLTTEELAEAKTISCDVLQNIEAAEAWRVQIRDYLREVMPCLSIPLQWGIRGWFMDGVLTDTMPSLYFLTLLFEPFLRLTLHLGEQSILQKSVSSDVRGEFYRVQYRMLDARGLLSPDNIAWLTSHLNFDEKQIAERVLFLAMKCRDAVAHGAISELSEEIRITYGHMIIKAIQLTVEAGGRQLEEIST